MPRLIVLSASLEMLSVDLLVRLRHLLLSEAATSETHSRSSEICVSLAHPGKVALMEASPLPLVTANLPQDPSDNSYVCKFIRISQECCVPMLASASFVRTPA